MHPADTLDRLRTYRNKTSDLTLTSLLGAEARKQRRAVRATGGIGDAWAHVIPDELSDKATVIACRRGVLSVRVRDASAMYRINTWLASGGLTELREASGRGITRVAFLHA